MFEDVLESIDALNAENVKNMAHLENVLEFHKIHMSTDDDKYILGLPPCTSIASLMTVRIRSVR